MERIARFAVIVIAVASVVGLAQLFLIRNDLKSLSNKLDELPKNPIAALPFETLSNLSSEERRVLAATSWVRVRGPVELESPVTVEFEQPISVELSR
jgi:hypothetical protein